jgi:hypothetical protein
MKARSSIDLPSRPSDAEALWYDLTRWPSFIDGSRIWPSRRATGPASGPG